MENMSLEDIKKTAEAIFDDIQEDNKEPRNQTNVMLRLEKMLERPGEYSFKEFVNICHQMKEVLERLQNLKCEDISNLDLKNIVRTVDENSIDAIYYREMAVSSLRVLYKKVVTNER